MKLTWDNNKRATALAERGLDFARCEEVFAGPTLLLQDDRSDYGEERWVTVGFLEGRMVVVVHTDRDDSIRIISMRYASGSERKGYEEKLG